MKSNQQEEGLTISTGLQDWTYSLARSHYWPSRALLAARLSRLTRFAPL